MKTIPIALAAEYARDTTHIATCLKVTRTDAVVVGWTDHDRTLTVSGVDYLPGFDWQGMQSGASLAVDTMMLNFLPGELDAVDLVAGKWVGASVEVFEANWSSLSDGVNVLKRGTTGEVKLLQGKYAMEQRGLSQALQQTQGEAVSKSCRVRFGSVGVARCNKDITAQTHTGALTTATSRTVIADSGRGEATGKFAEGVITFLTGNNAGYSQKVKAFASGVFTLSRPLPLDPQVGDTYSAVEGCDRTRTACKAYGNILNFQGEPDLPGVDEVTKAPTSDTQPAAQPTLP